MYTALVQVGYPYLDSCNKFSHVRSAVFIRGQQLAMGEAFLLGGAYSREAWEYNTIF